MNAHAPLVEQLGPAACRSYVVACRRSRDALLVDPLADDVDALLGHVAREGLRLRLVVDTHTHADHLSGGAEVARRAGVPYALHESTECPSVTERLRDRQRIEVGDHAVEVIHTPGHTPDSVTLHVERNLFTGDFLFLAQDGAGRLDLPGSDPGAHWDSLRRLAEFDDEHRVLPGHDYHGRAESTLSAERVRNPRFQTVTREEYVAWQRAVALPTPAWMTAVLAANLGRAPLHEAHHRDMVRALGACEAGEGGGACSAGPMARVPLVSPREAVRRLAAPESGRPFLLDVREEWEFAGPAGRHAPGAYLIPLGQVPYRIDELPDDPAHEILVICKAGGRSAHAAEILIAHGRRRVFNVAGGTDRWVREGLPVER